MGGLLVLVLIAGYISGTAKLFKYVGPYWAKALVVLAAILLPTADAVYGRIKLKQMCEAEGGLHIYRVVEGVEGFDDPTDEPREALLKTYGYRFIEGEELGGERSRLSLQADGMMVREIGITPISEYVYEMDKGDFHDTYHRTEMRIRVRSSGEVLSRAVNIKYAGGWVERFVSGLYAASGNAGYCLPFFYGTELVTKTLKPTRQEQTK